MPILPINLDHVKKCFSFLVESRQLENIQYLKILLAALRKHCWFQGCSSVNLLDTEDGNSNFGRFWVGLQKTIPEHVPEPKKALPPDTMSSVVQRMAQINPNSPDCVLVLRDILMFIFAYLGIKRAGCICKSNPDKIF